MHRKLITLLSTTAMAGAALAPAAGADYAPAPSKLNVTAAYAYVDHIAASKQSFGRVVFKTAKPLPRRYDGLIRAGGYIDGVGHSLSTAKRGTTWYAAASEIKGGSTATVKGGTVVRKGVRVGRSYSFKVTTRDGESFTRTLKLRGGKPRLSWPSRTDRVARRWTSGGFSPGTARRAWSPAARAGSAR